MGKTRDLLKKKRDTKVLFHSKMGSIKDRYGLDVTEAEDIKRWREYTEELYKNGTMLSKSLIQFSIVGWSCVPSLLFTWCQTMVEVMKIMVTSFKRSQACTATLSAPNHAVGHP